MIAQIKNNSVKIAFLISAGVIIASAFHFWPFPGRKLWENFNPANILIILWILLLPLFRNRKRFAVFFQDMLSSGILPFVLITFLSIAVALNPTRSLGFTIKLVLMFLGAYLLFRFSLANARFRFTLEWLTIISLLLSLTACFLARLLLNSNIYGFHINPYKYGTYLALLVPWCCLFLLLQNNWKFKVLAVLLVPLSLISAGSTGPILAIPTGLIIAVILSPNLVIRLCLLFALMLSSVIFLPISFLTALKTDLTLADTDPTHLKQRYIEWQAELNILQDRTLTGSGAGCINDLRSEYYHRLPKLNTLKPFDQNGWSALAGETGLCGLLAFTWIVCTHFKSAWTALEKNPFALANLAALTSAVIVHFFSSVFYNGNLVIFILILAFCRTKERSTKQNHILSKEPHRPCAVMTT